MQKKGLKNLKEGLIVLHRNEKLGYPLGPKAI